MKTIWKNSLVLRAAIVVLAGALVAGICLAADSTASAPHSELGLTMDLPEDLGIWRGSPGAVSQAEKELLPEDTEFSKVDYCSGYGAWQTVVHCSIVLSGKDRTSIHRPEVCLIGQGWNIDSSHERTVSLSNHAELAVRQLTLSREDQTGKVHRALYCYWFVGGDVTTADHLQRILLTARENIVSNRNPRWAYVSLLTGITAHEHRPGRQSEAETVAMLEKFIARLTPKFQTSFGGAKWF